MLEFNKSHKFFSQLSMVCKSVSKESMRYALTIIEVNEKHIVATDGRRLACLDNFGIDPGRYEVVKCTKSLIKLCTTDLEGNFPKYTDIIPECSREEDKKKMQTPDNAWNLPNAIKAKVSSVMFLLGVAGVCVYTDYLADFIACTDFYATESDRPVAFYADSFVGVIMPMKVNKV